MKMSEKAKEAKIESEVQKAKARADAWRVANTLRAGEVARYHTTPACGMQSVAAHSWGVAVIAAALDEHIEGRELFACLMHDAPEAFTGDIPAPFKKIVEETFEGFIEGRETAIAEAYFVRPPLLKGFLPTPLMRLADKLEALRHTHCAPRTDVSVRLNRALSSAARDILAAEEAAFSQYQMNLAAELIKMWSAV